MEMERSDDELGQPTLPGFQTLSSALAIGFRYSQHGSKVLYCGDPFAECVTSDAAECAVQALNYMDTQKDWARIIANVR